MISPEDLGKPARPKTTAIPSEDDSSDEEDDSSGDEDVLPPPKRQRKRRVELSKKELAHKASKWDLPIWQRRGFVHGDPTAKDYLILEFVENGDLRSLLAKCYDLKKRIPKRILWNFFLSRGLSYYRT
jgi:hypothetical protein